MDDLLGLTTMTLSTCGADGPHAAAVYFAAWPAQGLAALLEAGRLAELRLYFFSEPGSRHGQHLQASPQAAAALYPQAQGWQEIRGLQLRGQARRLEQGAEWQVGWGCYQARFPFVAALKPVIARNALYAFCPAWLRLVDNRLGFGFKQEWGG